jgi:hypothetical protein
LETAIQAVKNYFKGNASFDGVAVHDYVNYKKLKLVGSTIVKKTVAKRRSLYIW